MQFIKLLLLSLAYLVSIAVAANSAEYEALSKFKKGMQAGHAYAFKAGPIFGHQRLIVARITGTPGNLDVQAEMFQIYADADTNKKFQANKPEWDCKIGKYRYKGEVDGSLTYTDISIKGEVLLIGNTEYHLVTNNCIQHINNLLKAIKTREELIEQLRANRERRMAHSVFEKRQLDEGDLGLEY